MTRSPRQPRGRSGRRSPGDASVAKMAKAAKPMKTAKAKAKARAVDGGAVAAWVSPISYDASSSARLFRKVLQDLGYEFSRASGEKLYSRNLVIFPMPQVAHVYRFDVEAPGRFTIELWDTCVTSTATLSYIGIPDLSSRNFEAARKALVGYADRLARKPWVFPWVQRFQMGILTPEFFAAKKAWRLFVPGI